MNKQSHIIFSYAFDIQGKALRLNDEAVAEELKNDNLAWVHLDANNRLTKKWLEREVNYLDHLIIDALTAEETRPRLMSFADGLLIILRGVNLNKNSEPEDMASIRMWIDKDRIITMQRRDMKAVFDLRDQIDGGRTLSNSGEFLYNLIYQIIFVTSPFVYGLGEKIDILEEQIMTTHDLKFREEILQTRTQAAIFKRYLAPQKEVIAKLRISEHDWLDEWAKRHFQENLDQTTHLVEEADEASNRSKILHDELANAMSEKLNRNIFKMSLITMVFIPLTFVTGLFGMNFQIPGSDSQYSFYLCCSALFIVAALQILFFKKKDWF